MKRLFLLVLVLVMTTTITPLRAEDPTCGVNGGIWSTQYGCCHCAVTWANEATCYCSSATDCMMWNGNILCVENQG